MQSIILSLPPGDHAPDRNQWILPGILTNVSLSTTIEIRCTASGFRSWYGFHVVAIVGLASTLGFLSQLRSEATSEEVPPALQFFFPFLVQVLPGCLSVVCVRLATANVFILLIRDQKKRRLSHSAQLFPVLSKVLSRSGFLFSFGKAFGGSLVASSRRLDLGILYW